MFVIITCEYALLSTNKLNAMLPLTIATMPFDQCDLKCLDIRDQFIRFFDSFGSIFVCVCVDTHQFYRMLLYIQNINIC